MIPKFLRICYIVFHTWIFNWAIILNVTQNMEHRMCVW